MVRCMSHWSSVAERIEKTVEFLKKQGHKNLIWIPMNEKEIDGYICEGNNAEQ